MNVTLRQLRAFVAVARTGSFTLAAESLFITQSALSGLIKELEQTLGVRLVPDGHPKLLHLWPVKLLQAGRSDGDYTGVAVMREAASFKR